MKRDKYPCISCRRNEQNCNYVECARWRKWFHDEWKEIQDTFGAECVKTKRKERK